MGGEAVGEEPLSGAGEQGKAGVDHGCAPSLGGGKGKSSVGCFYTAGEDTPSVGGRRRRRNEPNGLPWSKCLGEGRKGQEVFSSTVCVVRGSVRAQKRGAFVGGCKHLCPQAVEGWI